MTLSTWFTSSLEPTRRCGVTYQGYRWPSVGDTQAHPGDGAHIVVGMFDVHG